MSATFGSTVTVAGVATFGSAVNPASDGTLNLGITGTARWLTGYFQNAVRVEGAGAIVTQIGQATLITQADVGQWSLYNTAGGFTGSLQSHFQWIGSGSKTALAIVSGAALELYANSSATVGMTITTSNNVTITNALAVAGAAGINGKTAVANVAAPTAAGAVYTATEQALLNDIRTRLINFGIYT